MNWQGQVFGALAMTTLLLGGNARAAEVELKVMHFLPAAAPAQKALIEPWAKAVEEQSGGRIAVKIYPAMQLGGKAPQLYDQLKDGLVDVVWTLPGYTPGRFPSISVFELPFMISDAVATSQAVQEFYQTQPMVQAELAEVHPLFLFTHARGVIHTKGVAIEKVADLEGVKIRIPSRAVGDAFSAYGAVPVSLPVPQTPEALSKNVIQGAVMPWEVTPSLRLYELTDHSTELAGPRGLYTSVFLFAMNKDKYDSLPPDLKQVIDANSGMPWARSMGEAWEKAELPGREAAIRRGNSIITMPESEVAKMQSLAQPVIDSWVADLDKGGKDGKALLAAAQELVAKYTTPTAN